MTTARRMAIICGIAGPLIFIFGWVSLGLSRSGYSTLGDAISELAHTRTSTQPWMSIAFVVFAVCIGAYASALRKESRLLGLATFVHGVAVLGVAATPLGTSRGSHFHALFAVISYITLTSLPLLAPSFRSLRWVAVPIGLALIVSVVGPSSVHGGFQRLGLTLGDVWFISTGVTLLRPATPRTTS